MNGIHLLEEIRKKGVRTPVIIITAYSDIELAVKAVKLGAEDFVVQVKETFFSLLRPYFSKIDDFINRKVSSNGAYFESYFFKNDYLSQFEDMSDVHLKFVQALVGSSQFIHFCDEFFSETTVGGDGELTNFQMFKSIMSTRGEFNEASGAHNDPGHGSRD